MVGYSSAYKRQRVTIILLSRPRSFTANLHPISLGVFTLKALNNDARVNEGTLVEENDPKGWKNEVKQNHFTLGARLELPKVKLRSNN